MARRARVRLVDTQTFGVGSAPPFASITHPPVPHLAPLVEEESMGEVPVTVEWDGGAGNDAWRMDVGSAAPANFEDAGAHDLLEGGSASSPEQLFDFPAGTTVYVILWATQDLWDNYSGVRYAITIEEIPAAAAGKLLITLPASAAYAAGDRIEVLVDGLSIAKFDLKPGGDDFPETEVITDRLAFGWHLVTVRVLDAVGNVSDGGEYHAFVSVGPRPPVSLRFASQVDDGPITFTLGKSLDDIDGGDLVEGYNLYRGLAPGTIDFNTVVGTAEAGASEITEDDNSRPTTDGNVAYAVRAINAGTYEDDASPATGTQVTVASGEVQLPAPLPVKVWTLEAAAEGRIRVSASVNNIGAETPVAALRVYSGDTAPSYAAPIGTIAVATSGASTVVGTFDPGLAHGTTCAVVIRAMSSDDIEEANTDAKTAVIDSEAPAELEGVTLEEVAA